jgi:hypothetical protein
MPSQQRLGRRLLVCCLIVVFDAVPAAAEEIRDWPCAAPLAERYDPVQVWGSPLPSSLPEGWRQDPGVREVVEFAANPENPPGEGAKQIVAFAAPLGAQREERLLLVFAGLLDQFNLLRKFVSDGVRDFVLRAKILRHVVAQHDAALAALPAEGAPRLEAQRRAYAQARSLDARSMDDAMEEAEFLCRRYGYLDRKLRELTAAIRAAL